MPLQISDRGVRFYREHGWTDADIAYLAANAERIEEDNKWVMGIGVAPDGVIWLYPAATGNIFPLSLWKRIKHYITNNPNVVIPMSMNTHLVEEAAKRYNGYLQDNLYMFGEQLRGAKLPKKGEMKW